MKFLIKLIQNPVEYKGDAIVWGTGETPFIDHRDSMDSRMVNGKVKFRTGLHPADIDKNKAITSEERGIFKTKLETTLPFIVEAYPEALDDTDDTFWNHDRTTMLIANSTFSNVFDTEENVEHALLYLAINAGSFGSISPTEELARRIGNRFYLTNEEDFVEKEYEEEFGIKRKAIAALSDLIDRKGIDPLLYITYLTVPNSKGYTKNTAKGIFEKTLMEFIENKNTKMGKKNASQLFYDNYMLFKNDKDSFIGQGILKAADHYGIIFFKDGKFITSINNTILESRIPESYKTMMKPDNQNEFDEIRKAVEEKLNK